MLMTLTQLSLSLNLNPNLKRNLAKIHKNFALHGIRSKMKVATMNSMIQAKPVFILINVQLVDRGDFQTVGIRQLIVETLLTLTKLMLLLPLLPLSQRSPVCSN